MFWGAWRVRERHRRGTVIRVAPRASRGALRTNLTLGGVAIPVRDETKHFKLIGTTGTGKSTAIRELLGAALRRGDRAVVCDPDADYLQHLGRRYRGDSVLNPFEADSLRWDLFAELKSDYDAEQLASALIASSADASTQEWRAYGRTLMAAVLRCCRRRSASLEELWRLLAIASVDELRTLLAGTPAQPFIEPENARMFSSIRSVTVSALAGLEYIAHQRAAPLSLRNWIASGRGVLFIPYRAAQIAALRTLIAAWLRLAIVEAMARPQGDQRLWFIVDELDALGAIDGLKDALARLRKFGARCVLAFQSVAQVSSTYGTGEAQTIIENCCNTLILRCASSEHGGTSQFASRLIGERELLRRHLVRGREAPGWPHGARRSLQISEHPVTESAVLASELEQLPDLVGYLKTASSRAWLRVNLAHTKAG